MFDRSAHRVTSRIVIMGNHRLIALIDIPVNVTLVSLRVSHKPVRLIRDLINTDSCDCICIVNPGGSRTGAGAWSVEFSDDSICVSHEATLFVCLAGVDESHDLAAIVDFGGKGIGRIGRIEGDERSIHIS